MSLRKRRPVTPGSRFAILSDFSEITKKEPEKSLVRPLRKKGGRNFSGRIVVRHRGGGEKRKYRLVDFRQMKGESKVLAIEYDPNRSSRIALLQYSDGRKSYVLAPAEIEVGNKIFCGEKVSFTSGNRLPLSDIPEGTSIYNLEFRPNRGGKLVRAAGESAVILSKTEEFAQVKLPSGEVRLFLLRCQANVGQVSNPEHRFVSLGKAGRKRRMGIRPTVRGVAMNPVDHPLGGGEGKSSGGRPTVTPWGKPEGIRTRNKKKESEKHIIKHRTKRKK